jgi:disulfide bond formation protein DsbB
VSIVPVVERVFALLAIVAVTVAVAGVAMLFTRRVPDWLRSEVALPLAAAIAVVATAGSLFASEVAGYPPCVLCWYQRAAMYPLALVLTVAAATGRRGVWRLGVPVAALGGAIATWHVVVERMPAASGAVCDPEAPCSVRWIEEFGVFTLPSMALIAFLAIVVLLLLARSSGERESRGAPPGAQDDAPRGLRGHPVRRSTEGT